MAQAAGVFKTVAYKAEVTYGLVPAAASAQALRRVTSDLSLTKQTYQSNEIRPDQQVADYRHGVRSVDGSINGELSPATYADFIAAALRRDFAAVTAITGASITVAGAGPTYTITRAAGSFLTDGVKAGDVVRLSAGAFNANNLLKNIFVVSLTATVLTVRTLNASTLTAEGPIATSTVTVFGKKTYAPTSSHTNKSFSIEHWFSDIAQSEVFSGCQPTKLDFQLPPTGLATINIGMIGQDITTDTSQYFTSPTAVTTTGVTAAVNGLILVSGVVVASVTGLSVSIDSARTGDAVVGSNIIPTRFSGRITASGQVTAYFEDATLRDAFIDETEASIFVVLTADNTASSAFVGFTMPRVKMGGASKSDGVDGIVQTIPFMALLDTTGGAGTDSESTTISVQDSNA